MSLTRRGLRSSSSLPLRPSRQVSTDLHRLLPKDSWMVHACELWSRSRHSRVRPRSSGDPFVPNSGQRGCTPVERCLGVWVRRTTGRGVGPGRGTQTPAVKVTVPWTEGQRWCSLLFNQFVHPSGLDVRSPREGWWARSVRGPGTVDDGRVSGGSEDLSIQGAG